MRLRNLLSKLFGQSARKNRVSKSASERQTNRSLRMESLEGRALMATLTGTEPPLLDHIAPPPPAGYFGLPTNGCDEDDDDIKHGTVTVTLQATNDAPLAPMAPNYAARTNNDPAPIVFNPLNQLNVNGVEEDDDDIKHGTVTVTLQATNDAPFAPMAPNYAARTNNGPAPIVFNPLIQLNINGVEEDDDDIKHGTVTVTLHATNDAPLAPMAPNYAARTNDGPAPIVFNPLNQLNINGVEEDDDDIKHGTVTVTLQATNDAPLAPMAPLAPIAPSNTGTL